MPSDPEIQLTDNLIQRATDLLLAAGYRDPNPKLILESIRFLARCDAATQDAERRRGGQADG